MDINKINGIIDTETRALVGKLCKRVEVLEGSNSLSPQLYKSLAKELLYESSRNLKQLIELQSKLFKLEFKTRPTREKDSE